MKEPKTIEELKKRAIIDINKCIDCYADEPDGYINTFINQAVQIERERCLNIVQDFVNVGDIIFHDKKTVERFRQNILLSTPSQPEEEKERQDSMPDFANCDDCKNMDYTNDEDGYCLLHKMKIDRLFNTDVFSLSQVGCALQEFSTPSQPEENCSYDKNETCMYDETCSYQTSNGLCGVHSPSQGKEEGEKMLPWIRYRFKTKSIKDIRPLIFNPAFPWWCSCYGDDYATIVAWLPKGEYLLKYWDDAFEIGIEEKKEIEFSDRFPKPDYYSPTPSQPEVMQNKKGVVQSGFAIVRISDNEIMHIDITSKDAQSAYMEYNYEYGDEEYECAPKYEAIPCTIFLHLTPSQEKEV